MSADGGAPDAQLGEFGSPAGVDGLSVVGPVDDDPTLTGDELEIYYKSTRDGGADIYRAVRTSVAVPFGPATKDLQLSGADQDDTPEVSVDGLTMHFASDRDASEGTDIWRAIRPNRESAWGAPVRVVELSSGDNDYAMVTDDAGLHAVLGRIDGDGDLDLFRARRASVLEPWGSVEPIDELNTEAYEADAVLDDSGTRLYFTSDRPGGAGGRDLWLAERATPTAPFAPPALVAELATAADEEDPWISPDLRALYYVSNASGEQELVVARR